MLMTYLIVLHQHSTILFDNDSRLLIKEKKNNNNALTILSQTL
jgi:hypothetical protein